MREPPLKGIRTERLDSATRPKEEKMKALPQVLFWLGLISIPFAWLVWYFGPPLEILRPVFASISDPALRAALQAAHAERLGIGLVFGKYHSWYGVKFWKRKCSDKTRSPLLTNDWFSIGRVERSSRMGGKFDPEHFGIERNVVAYRCPPGPAGCSPAPTR